MYFLQSFAHKSNLSLILASPIYIPNFIASICWGVKTEQTYFHIYYYLCDDIPPHRLRVIVPHFKLQCLLFARMIQARGLGGVLGEIRRLTRGIISWTKQKAMACNPVPASEERTSIWLTNKRLLAWCCCENINLLLDYRPIGAVI